MTEANPTVIEHIRRFEGERDAHRLMQAADAISADMSTGSAEARARKRAGILLSWIVLLNEIDRSRDPDFNFDDLPMDNMAPRGQEGRLYRSGIASSAVENPVERRQYEEDLDRNRRKAAEYRLQKGLRDAERYVSARAEAFIRRNYSSTPEDIAEIRAVLQEQPPASERARRLRAVRPEIDR